MRGREVSDFENEKYVIGIQLPPLIVLLFSLLLEFCPKGMNLQLFLLWEALYLLPHVGSFFFFFKYGFNLAVSSLSCGMWDLVFEQGLNLGLLYWECGVLATDPSEVPKWLGSFGGALLSLPASCQMHYTQ